MLRNNKEDFPLNQANTMCNSPKANLLKLCNNEVFCLNVDPAYCEAKKFSEVCAFCYLVVIKIEITITSWNISLNFNKTEQAS